MGSGAWWPSPVLPPSPPPPQPATPPPLPPLLPGTFIETFVAFDMVNIPPSAADPEGGGDSDGGRRLHVLRELQAGSRDMSSGSDITDSAAVRL